MSPPRDYQIDELTRGVRQPLTPLQHRPLKVIAEFLTEAWDGLLETREHILRTREEKEVNALMDARLNDLAGKRPEWKMLITGVTRGRESISHDGSSLEKRPDLSIHLTNRFQWPLIVECKLIDSGSGKGVDKYCKDGLARFVDGDYAWYVHEAFMIAYVRDNTTIAGCLTPYLDKRRHKTPDPFLTLQLPHPEKSISHDMARSRHERCFSNNPGPIDIWHIWVS